MTVPPTAAPSKGSRRRRRWLIALATVVALIGAAISSGTYLMSNVDAPQFAELPSSSTLYYSDGSVLANVGSVQRHLLTYEEIAPVVTQVAVAAEDPDFWSNDTGSITRAAVRYGTDLRGDGTNVRIRLYALARKATDVYSKNEILAYYLNAIPFGRGTYGVEAAARAYFGKSANRTAPGAPQVTMAEAMLLMALTRLPNGELEQSRQRWAEIRDAVVAQGVVSAEEASALRYPTIRPEGPRVDGLDGPAAMVLPYVLAELTGDESPLRGRSWEQITDGGFDIMTTLDPVVQSELELAADETVEGSVMAGQPANLQAAGVVVEPGTGRVLGYYGGSDPTGTDFAGVYLAEDGTWVGFGAHPAGSSFLVHTLAAALRVGFALGSQWQWTPHEQFGPPVRNEGVCPSSPTGPYCSLLESFSASLNVALSDVIVTVGPAAVFSIAHDAGIGFVWNEERERFELTIGNLTQLGLEVLVGVYAVTVIDQANAMATYAAGGLPARAHFVRTVSKAGDLVFGETLPTPYGARILNLDEAADVRYALTRPPGDDTLAFKTGTSKSTVDPSLVADAWAVGFTDDLAAAIWVGDRNLQGAPIGSAADLPGQILRRAISSRP